MFLKLNNKRNYFYKHSFKFLNLKNLTEMSVFLKYKLNLLLFKYFEFLE